MNKPGAERRRCQRFSIQRQAYISLLFPEETFSPQRLPATTRDVSEGGVSLVTRHIPKEIYQKLIRGIHHCKLDFPISSDLNFTVHGLVVWLDFHDGTPATTHVGIAFSKPQPILIRELTGGSGNFSIL